MRLQHFNIRRCALALITLSAYALPAFADQAAAPVGIDFENPAWLGDLDGMTERRLVRVLVPYSKTLYFIDSNGTQRGISYDLMREFEKTLNKKLNRGKLTVHFVFLPVPRDRLLPDLVAGLGDIAAANLTITPQRSEIARFTVPLASDVKEVLVTGPNSPQLATLEDLAGQEVFVRRSTSYFESLTVLSARLQTQGRKPIKLREAPGHFETEDMLQMVNAGLAPIVVTDEYLGDFWKQIFTSITVRNDLVLRQSGDIAFAVRKRNPQLLGELNTFMRAHRRGTTFGNVTLQKYLKSTRWAKSATTEAEIEKFNELGALFQKYGAQYNIDWLLMAAQAYQESGLDHSVRSPVGAVGVMQVMPATGKELKVGDIHKLEPNIHAGVKYVRFMIDQYYKDEPMDDINKVLFAFASYNAGPARVTSLRKQAAARKLDPNVWFNNVELIAAQRIGHETVDYVANIYKYYVAYTLALERARERVSPPPPAAASKPGS